MSVAQFSLVKKTPVTILRETQGSFIDGDWVEGTQTSVDILANVHPFTDYQVSLMPESDRSKDWVWLFTSSLVQQKKEGSNGNGADRFMWLGDMYEVMKTQRYVMQVQDHVEAKCVRIEITPN